MDHRPYEDWLLNDTLLAPEQERDLRVHLRNCPDCAMLSRANLMLRTAPVVASPPGFTARFQTRLAAERRLQRKRNIWGMILLGLVGGLILVYGLLPYLSYFSLSPLNLLITWVNSLIYVALTARTVSILGNTLFGVLASLIPPYVWALSLTLIGVMGILWTVSFRRIGKLVHTSI